MFKTEIIMKSFSAIGICFLILSLGFSGVFAQKNDKFFESSKDLGDRRVVYFDIIGIAGDEANQELALERLFEDPEIFDGDLMPVGQNNVRCRLEVSYLVSVEYIRNIMDDMGLQIDVNAIANSMVVNQSKIYTSEFTPIPVFNLFLDWEEYARDNLGLSPDEYYQKKKMDWVEKNPAEYEKSVKESGTTVVVYKKDLDTYDAEKQKYILSHPEIFIIEE